MKKILVSFVFSLLFISTNAFSAGKPNPTNKITFGELSVSATNDEWTQTSVKVKDGDLLFVMVLEDNLITVGKYLGAATANGIDNGIGLLEMKIGTGKSRSVGTKGSLLVMEAGILKFRIYDTNYQDNSGAFNVLVIHVPVELIPEQPKNIEQSQ